MPKPIKFRCRDCKAEFEHLDKNPEGMTLGEISSRTGELENVEQVAPYYCTECQSTDIEILDTK